MSLKIIETEPLNPVTSYYVNNLPELRNYLQIVDPHNDYDWNDTVYMWMSSNMYKPEVQNVVISYAKMDIKMYERNKKLAKQVSNSQKKQLTGRFWLVTFTSDPDKDEIQNICDMNKYRIAHFKKYKYCYVEEKKSADSEKYHQHILIEAPLRVVHTGQNLKPCAYYKGNKNTKPIPTTKKAIEDTMKYLQKENVLQGSVGYFLSLKDTLP